MTGGQNRFGVKIGNLSVDGHRFECSIVPFDHAGIEFPNNLRPSPNTSDGCDLCGLSLRAGRFKATFSDKTYQFCCQGCRQVFSILIEATESGDPATFRDSDLFKQVWQKA